MNDLVRLLRQLPPGPIDDHAEELVAHLSRCWDQFDGASLGHTTGDKFARGITRVTWTPPCLSFALERHGAYARGSGSADVHHWSVNVSAKTARLAPRSQGRRINPA